MNAPIWLWVLFNGLILGLLALDLGVFHRKAHAVSVREATLWSAVWVSLAMLFNLGIYLTAGSEPALQFLSGYLIEKSLAVDNIFVFVLIFGAFAVPAAVQHRVLFWGVLGALLMRGALIGLGSFLIKEFHWVLYLFGAFLLFTGLRMLRSQERPVDLERHRVVRLVRRVLPVTPRYHGSRFLVRQAGRIVATPLLLVLVLVEVSDLIFAVDSIPAIFAVTQEPFLVYSSNVFAILGLRSMYFLLNGVVDRFHLLKYGLAAVLSFVGAKMLLADVYAIPIALSLAVIVTMLLVSVIVSLRVAPRPEASTQGTRRPSSAVR